MRSSFRRFRLPSKARRRCSGRPSSSQRDARGRVRPPLVAMTRSLGYGWSASAISSSSMCGPYESAVSKKLQPSSYARRSTASACARSFGGPHTPGPQTRMAPKPRRWTSRSPTFIGELLDRASEAQRDARHAQVVELLGRVAWQMVMRVAVERGVGDHDGRVVVLAERPVVRPCDAWNRRGGGDAFRWKARRLAESADRSPYQRAAADIADEGDEIASIRIEPAERRRIVLAARRVAVIAEHLERKHRCYFLARRIGARRIGVAAHLVALEVRHLLVGKGDEACRQSHARKLDQHRDAGRIVVGAGRARHSVVVRAHDDGAGTGLDVAHGAAAALERLLAKLAELGRDIARRAIEIAIPLAGGERGDMRAQALRERALLRREFERAAIGAARHGEHVVEGAREERNGGDYGRNKEDVNPARTRARQSGPAHPRCRPTGAPGPR